MALSLRYSFLSLAWASPPIVEDLRTCLLSDGDPFVPALRSNDPREQGMAA